MNTYKVTIVRGKQATVITVNASNSGQAKSAANATNADAIYAELVIRANKGTKI